MKKWFEKICIGLIFFLSALLLMFFGIRTAGKTIAFARAERIEVINNLVDGISEGANLTSQGKKMQTVVYEYLKAFLRAVAGFEFVPRNDFSILTHIINSLPRRHSALLCLPREGFDHQHRSSLARAGGTDGAVAGKKN